MVVKPDQDTDAESRVALDVDPAKQQSSGKCRAVWRSAALAGVILLASPLVIHRLPGALETWLAAWIGSAVLAALSTALVSLIAVRLRTQWQENFAFIICGLAVMVLLGQWAAISVFNSEKGDVQAVKARLAEDIATTALGVLPSVSVLNSRSGSTSAPVDVQSTESIAIDQKRLAYQKQLQADLLATAPGILADYPYLDTPAGASVLERVLNRRDELMQGIYLSLALAQAANRFAPEFAP